MSTDELLAQINAASLPEPLKIQLSRLGEAMSALLPALEPLPRRQAGYALERLVKEAVDPSVEVHWWETALDLLAKSARGQGEAGMPALEAIAQVQKLLPAQMGSTGPVTLREISMDTVFMIILLSETLTPPKANYVAPNVYSLAQAHFNPHSWFRAIYAGKAPVGFLMIVDNPEEAEYFLWRFMIGEPFHGRGYGRQAIERLVEYVRTRPGAKELLVSCGQGEGSPEGFYQRLGFVHTGNKVGEEVVLRLTL